MIIVIISIIGIIIIIMVVFIIISSTRSDVGSSAKTDHGRLTILIVIRIIAIIMDINMSMDNISASAKISMNIDIPCGHNYLHI